MKNIFFILLVIIFSSCSNNSADLGPHDSAIVFEDSDILIWDNDIMVTDEPISNGETTSTKWEADPAFTPTLREGISGGFVPDHPVTPTAPNYTIPIASLNDITNLRRDIVEKAGITLSPAAQSKLLQNGFVVLPGSSTRFDYVYSAYQDKEIPVFVSADSILHLYHLAFDQILKNIEITYLANDLKLLAKALLDETGRLYNSFSDQRLKEAALLAYGQCAVVLRLLDDSFPLNTLVAEPVAYEVSRIIDETPPTGSALFSFNCPKPLEEICSMGAKEQQNLPRATECFCEDYTQYKPRGHYTQTELLQRYFRAMMYLGRMGYLMRGDRATIAAVILTHALKRAKASDGRSAKEIWERMYRVTSFFAGNADDLLPAEYDAAFLSVFGAGKDIALLAIPSNMEKFVNKIETLRDPKIPSGMKHALLETREATKGMRLMGQRFTPDTYLLSKSVLTGAGIDPQNSHKAEIYAYMDSTAYTYCQNEVSCTGVSSKDPLSFTATDIFCVCAAAKCLAQSKNDQSYATICRFLPSGLDAMIGLGSTAAKRIFSTADAMAPAVDPYRYVALSKTHNLLIDEFAAYTLVDWGHNLFFGWLYLLKPLLNEYAAPWPVFMQTNAWEDFTLNSALSSWVQLRRDTILYLEQSYSDNVSTEFSPPNDDDYIYDPKYYAYVEPIPALFDRAAQLTAMTLEGITMLGLLTTEMYEALTSTQALMEKVRDLSIAQLQTGTLPESDAYYLMTLGDKFSSIIKQMAAITTIGQEGPCSSCESSFEGDGVNDPLEVRLVADVHTDTNLGNVLEVATGPLDFIIVVRKMDNGSLGAAIGPVFSYREFPWPVNNRLTDEEWRSLVKSDTQKFVPKWALSFKSQ